MKWISLSLTICLLSTHIGCKKKVVRSETGYVLGPSNDIEVYREGAKTQVDSDIIAATALIVTTLDSQKRKFCTGTLIRIDQNRAGLISNFHCFANANSEGVVDKFFFAEACTKTKVYFGVTRSTHSAVKEHQCQPGSLMGDQDGDLAFFEINDLEDVLKTREPLKFWDEAIIEKRDAMMAHHPDIEANYEVIGNSGASLPVMSITEKDCRTISAFDTNEWLLDPALPYSFKHSCDLVHGSSGSALIDQRTHKILGINWGGIEIQYGKGSETVNSATSAGYALAFLNGDTTPIRAQAEDVKAREIENQRKQQKTSVAENLAKCSTIDHATDTKLWLTLMLLLMPITLLLSGRVLR